MYSFQKCHEYYTHSRYHPHHCHGGASSALGSEVNIIITGAARVIRCWVGLLFSPPTQQQITYAAPLIIIIPHQLTASVHQHFYYANNQLR